MKIAHVHVSEKSTVTNILLMSNLFAINQVAKNSHYAAWLDRMRIIFNVFKILNSLLMLQFCKYYSVKPEDL